MLPWGDPVSGKGRDRSWPIREERRARGRGGLARWRLWAPLDSWVSCVICVGGGVVRQSPRPTAAPLESSSSSLAVSNSSSLANGEGTTNGSLAPCASRGRRSCTGATGGLRRGGRRHQRRRRLLLPLLPFLSSPPSRHVHHSLLRSDRGREDNGERAGRYLHDRGWRLLGLGAKDEVPGDGLKLGVEGGDSVDFAVASEVALPREDLAGGAGRLVLEGLGDAIPGGEGARQRQWWERGKRR